MAEDVTVGIKDGKVIELSERDAEICRLYINGLTLQQIGDHYGKTREWTRQVLRKCGVYKTDRKDIAKTVRHKFLGINISNSAKVALCQEAIRRGLSVSALTAEWIDEKLSELVPIVPATQDQGQKSA